MRIFKEQRKLKYIGDESPVKIKTGKGVVILGSGKTSYYFDKKPKDFELWTVNHQYRMTEENVDRNFYFDRCMFDLKFGKLGFIKPEDMNKWGGIVTSPWKHPKITRFQPYPLKDIYNKFKVPYFTSSLAYMMAHAIYLGYKEIHIYGCEFNSGWELIHNEKGCMEFWVGYARAKGIKVLLHEDSYLCKDAFYGIPPEAIKWFKEPYYLSERFYPPSRDTDKLLNRLTNLINRYWNG